MTLFAVGLNHRSAPLALRERLAFSGEALPAALAALPRAHAAEAAILSTCNRTELYICAERPEAAAGWLGDYHRVASAELSPFLYTHSAEDAVRHAFRVASGLDSMVLGEPQILGQMKRAAEAAHSAGSLGCVLHQLFQRAFGVAKEVRCGTRIGEGATSLAAAALRLASRIFPSIAEESVLFIGAGEMIELCAGRFAAKTPARLTMASRTLARAEALAHRCGGDAMALKDLPEHLHRYDIVVSCTASSLPILGKGLIERALRARRRRPMLLIDLAVPRDIEPEAAKVDGVFLYALDDLQGMLDDTRESRRGALQAADDIVETQVGRFMRWVETRARVPLIRALREQAESTRMSEVQSALHRLELGQSPASVIEALSQALTNKLLHSPTRALHDATAPVDAVRRLYRLG